MPSTILSDNGVSSGSAGLKTTAASDGILALQTTTSGGTATNAIYVDTSQNVGVGVTPSGNYQLQAGSGSGAAGRGFNLMTLAGGYSGGDYPIFGYNFRTTTTGGSYLYNVSDVASAIGFSSVITFNTASSGTAGNSISFNERARINSNGNLLVGTTSPIGGERLNVTGNVADDLVRFYNAHNSSPFGVAIVYSAISPNNTVSGFVECYDSVGQRATIRSNGGLANYSANNVNLSDRREKTNFAPAGDYLAKICAIPVQTYNYIDQNMEEDGGLTLGVVAQDVQEIAPELVTESNWGTEEEPKMRLSIYQTDLQYALMKSIQELKAIVDAQAAEIAALKGN
jgi:hypothetical protein